MIHGDWRAREAGRGGLVKRSVVILLLKRPSGGLQEREGRRDGQDDMEGAGRKDEEGEEGSRCRDFHPSGVGVGVKYFIRITKNAFVTGHQCVTRSQLVTSVTYSGNDNVLKSHIEG